MMRFFFIQPGSYLNISEFSFHGALELHIIHVCNASLWTSFFSNKPLERMITVLCACETLKIELTKRSLM